MAAGTAVTQFAQERFGREVDVRLTPLRGGLEAAGIARAVVQRKGNGIASFVVKPFAGGGRRELDVYRLLNASPEYQFAPTLLGWHYTSEAETAGYMFLEWVAARQRWPWRDVSSSAAVVDRLAHLHRLDPEPLSEVLTSSWDYDSELIESARSTLNVYESAFLRGMRPGGRPMVRTFERIIDQLPRLRRNLMSFTGTTLLHGDAHPGNVVLRNSTAVLLDWGRARLGSPLEDLSSWVHSLAFWEPEAKRRHDTLLSRYRAASGSDAWPLSRDYRDALILAGAFNSLSGALRYHLVVMGDPGRSDRDRVNSYRAGADWLRILRRADAVTAR